MDDRNALPEDATENAFEPAPENFGFTVQQPPTFPMSLQVGDTLVKLYANGAAEVDVSALERNLNEQRGAPTLETVALWTLFRVLKSSVGRLA